MGNWEVQWLIHGSDKSRPLLLHLKGDIFAIFVIALAAAEAAIGLSILSSIHRNRKSTRINQSNFLNN
ncbi:hypothetical protein BDA96_07G142800 [Sorghum bicolor]|uniref:NADH-plastoquinone oxidoreductase subunit 4L n=2 Tax=Sorghum bicolor TaxID=4558 RepID=A0A921QL05_SORBI|nr:hypothetical protein BDA96_07G142800 [Sorghum bicolor]KXG25187.1 hypothetical protein SORBI_3007G133500 [Sorghum bicolor]